MKKRLQTLIQLTIISLISLGNDNVYAQIQEQLPVKIHHAEPLYNDLVRDLGARKGEKELNIGADFKNLNHYKELGFIAEYEFAPINRLGLEIETDFSFFKGDDSKNTPGNKLDCLRLSTQYSFFVSEKYATTLAVGYSQIFDFTEFKNLKNGKWLTGTTYSPSIIVAKNWKDKFHLLFFSGPKIQHDFEKNATVTNWQINTSFHYTLTSGHFIGLEINQLTDNNTITTTLRPQIKLKLNENTAIGMVAGFPIKNKEEGFSSFFRLIYEL